MTSEKTLSLKNIQEHPIKTSIGSGLAIIMALWAAYRPLLIEDLSADFVTKTELAKKTDAMTAQLRNVEDGMSINKAALDGLVTQVNVSAAFQMERGFQEDLDKHLVDKADQPSRRWLETQRDLTAKRNLATQYKNCVIAESKNCDLLQKQLWQ